MAGFLVGIGKAGEVAERSPAVISANLKEEMLLQKKRMVLDRSARNLIHQIKVDQKVVYKNFQSRLIRSKLAFARLMGQKDIEKELRAKNLGGLNTDIVGSAEEEYSFLDKLEHRPCTATSISPRVAMPKRYKVKCEKSVRNNLNLVKNSSMAKRAVSTVLNERPVSATATVQTNIKVKPSTSQRDKEIRPATTTGMRVDNDFTRHQERLLNDNKDEKKIQPTDNDIDVDEDKENSVESSNNDTKQQTLTPGDDTNIEHTGDNRPSTKYNAFERDGDLNEAIHAPATASDLEETEEIGNGTKPSVVFLENLELDLEKLRRPKTVALTRQASGMSESPPISPKLLSGRASSRASDFFQEEKKIDIIQLRLNAARAVDFTAQVKTFCESLEKTQDSRNKPTSDYYTLRLAASMKERVMSEIPDMPGTPDDENRRAVGNIHIRSLTLPDIDWNFE